MILEKMLKKIYQKQNYFIPYHFVFFHFIFSFIRTPLFTRCIKKAELKKPSKDVLEIAVLRVQEIVKIAA